MEELNLLRKTANEMENRRNEFKAALQGVDLRKSDSSDDEFNKVKAQAQADLAGVSKFEYAMTEVGIAIESDDD